jgi:hypothetical protein
MEAASGGGVSGTCQKLQSQRVWNRKEMTKTPNPITSPDAGFAFCFHIGRRWLGASEFLR